MTDHARKSEPLVPPSCRPPGRARREGRQHAPPWGPPARQPAEWTCAVWLAEGSGAPRGPCGRTAALQAGSSDADRSSTSSCCRGRCAALLLGRRGWSSSLPPVPSVHARLLSQRKASVGPLPPSVIFSVLPSPSWLHLFLFISLFCVATIFFT